MAIAATQAWPRALHPDDDEMLAACHRLVARGVLKPEAAYDRRDGADEGAVTTVYRASEEWRTFLVAGLN